MKIFGCLIILSFFGPLRCEGLREAGRKTDRHHQPAAASQAVSTKVSEHAHKPIREYDNEAITGERAFIPSLFIY